MAHEDVNFGERLRTLRERAGLSLGALALKVGVTEGAIRQMEYGHTKTASFPVGIRLADALNVTPHYLATGNEMRLVAPEGIEASVTGAGLSIGLAPGYILYGGSMEEFGDRMVAHVLAAVKERGFTIVPRGDGSPTRPPAAAAAETESPGPSAADLAARLDRVEAGDRKTAAALREIQESLGLRPRSKKKASPSA